MAGSSYDTYGSNNPYRAKYPGLETATSKGTYWKGSDGNVWVYGDQGTNSAGKWDANTDAYWSGLGYTGTTAPFTGVLGLGISTAGADNTQLQGGGTYTGGTSGPAYRQEDVDLINNQIGEYNKALGRIPGQLNTGLANILNSYNAGVRTLDNQFNEAKGQYDTQKADTGQDYTQNRYNIGQQAGLQLNAIRRLLGSQGAGRSSAAQVLAPYASALQAGTRFGQVQDQFSRNQRDLDTAWTGTKNKYNAEKEGLATDRTNQENQLRAGIAQNEIDINKNLGDLYSQRSSVMGGNAQNVLAAIAPYQSRIQALLDQIDSYGKLAVSNPGEVKYNRPDLADYNYSRFDAPVGQTDPRAAYVSPFARMLTKREEEKNLASY